jgi:hypothetical protein
MPPLRRLAAGAGGRWRFLIGSSCAMPANRPSFTQRKRPAPVPRGRNLGATQGFGLVSGERNAAPTADVPMEEGVMTEEVKAPSAAKIAQFLKGIDFPVQKEALIAHATGNAAEPTVIETLQRLPSGPYDNMADVANAIRRLA